MADIELKNRRWKQSSAVAIIVFMVAIGYLVVANYQNGVKQTKTLEGLKAVQDNQAKTLDALLKLGGQIQTTTKESQAHIDCIAQLFAKFTRDGESITIVDLSSCQAEASQTTLQPIPSSPENANSTTQSQNPPTLQNLANNQSPKPITRTITDFVTKATKGVTCDLRLRKC